MDDQRRIALVETQTVDESEPVIDPIPLQRYQLGNHLGSVSLELDEFGDLISYEEYHPYGTTSFQAGRSAAEVSLKRYRYTAKERDDESGLNYHGARYYAPWLARWVSADPAGMVDGMNLYAYVRGNPVKLIDPTGNAPEFVLENSFPPRFICYRSYSFGRRTSGRSQVRNHRRWCGCDDTDRRKWMTLFRIALSERQISRAWRLQLSSAATVDLPSSQHLQQYSVLFPSLSPPPPPIMQWKTSEKESMFPVL